MEGEVGFETHIQDIIKKNDIIIRLLLEPQKSKVSVVDLSWYKKNNNNEKLLLKQCLDAPWVPNNVKRWNVLFLNAS